MKEIVLESGHRTRRNTMNCEEYIINRLTKLESENERLHILLSMKRAEINDAKSQTGETKTEIEYNGFQKSNGIGEAVDVVIDKKGRKWPIIKLHEGIYGFRDCPFCTKYNKSGKNCDFKKSDAYKETIKWCDENMTPEQREFWGEPFIASMYNIMGEKAYKYAKQVEVEIQFDYYKDWHNRIKSCQDLYEKDETDFGAWYWTSSPRSAYANSVCCVDGNGGASINVVDGGNGVSPCFRRKEQTEERPEFDDKEVTQNDLQQGSWYYGKYNGGGWPPR